MLCCAVISDVFVELGMNMNDTACCYQDYGVCPICYVRNSIQFNSIPQHCNALHSTAMCNVMCYTALYVSSTALGLCLQRSTQSLVSFSIVSLSTTELVIFGNGGAIETPWVAIQCNAIQRDGMGLDGMGWGRMGCDTELMESLNLVFVCRSRLVFVAGITTHEIELPFASAW